MQDEASMGWNAGVETPAFLLEDPPCRQHQFVVLGVELAGGDLHAGAKGQAGARLRIGGGQSAFAHNQSWGNELLRLAVVRSALVEGGVAFDLRPEELGDAVLRHGIPDYGTAGVG